MSTDGANTPGGDRQPASDRLAPIRRELGRLIRQEEAAFGRTRRPPDTLMGHLERVAAHAVRLARAEGVDPHLAELAALFHDAGKFHGGRYHEDDQPEEEHSVAVLRDLGGRHGLDAAALDAVAAAIRQLYRDDPDSTPLSMLLFDADNLDKLGLPGMALYFIKSGLRGQSLSRDMIIRLTVELTYARYAARGLYTRAARAIAAKRSAETIRFIHDLLDALREDGLFDARIDTVRVGDLDLEVIRPAACPCGGAVALTSWIEQGKKCTEIHLAMTCAGCADRHEIRFCRPRLIG